MGLVEVHMLGINKAIKYFKELGENIGDYSVLGMREGAEEIKKSINIVVPHKGIHLPEWGACYHNTFTVIVEEDFYRVRCGPTVPYVKILEKGTLATAGEFPAMTKQTKSGSYIVGQQMIFRGIPAIFHLRGRPLEPRGYLHQSVSHALANIRDQVISWIRDGVRMGR